MTALFRRQAAELPSASTADDEDYAEKRAEKRRMSFWDLFFLAAAGVVGSGWLLGAANAEQGAGPWAVFSWLIGGALILTIAAVMVELSARQPKTGGLTFLPFQTCGPLLATVVAAGLWVFYAVSPASQGLPIVQGIVEWTRRPGRLGLIRTIGDSTILTGKGICLAALCMLLISAVNLLGPRLFLRVNNVLTAFKIAVPLTLVLLLAWAATQHLLHAGHVTPPPPGRAGHASSFDVVSVFTTLTSSGLIYAYLGFQGPLDFAGSVKRKGRWQGKNEAVRLRRAVYGTVCGSIILYTALQGIIIYLGHNGVKANGSPYIQFIHMAAPAWLAGPFTWVLHLDMVLSPVGAAMVFTYVLTREVAALSRVHLTHRGLQKRSRSEVPVPGNRLKQRLGERLDVYWLILLIDFLLSGVALLCFAGGWTALTAATSVLALVVYATPSVVLAALHRTKQIPVPLSGWRRSLPEVAFVLIAVIFFLTSWAQLWPGMAAFTVGCVVLFALPVVTAGERWYDATAYVRQFRHIRTNPAAKSAVVLFGFFAGLTLASLPYYTPPWQHASRLASVIQLASAVPVVILAMVVFRWLVRLSADYMKDNPPTLPNSRKSPGTPMSPSVTALGE
jgi:amino acid transporter